ncbi:hypothetical protein HQ535_15520 [bacterium]|nr:hypothetical protein [bacterium]
MSGLLRSKALIVAVAVLALAEVGARVVAARVGSPVTWDSPYTQDKAAQILELGREQGGADIVFLGSSIVNAGIEPSIITASLPPGIVAYNAGIPGSSAGTWRVWAQDTVYRHLCPEVVVIGVTVRDINDNAPGVASDPARYLESRGRKAFIGSTGQVESGLSAIESISALVRVRGLLRRPVDTLKVLTGRPVDGWRLTRLTEFGRYYAFDAKVYALNDARRDRLRTSTFRDFSVGGIETAAIVGMIDDAHAGGAIVVLVETPVMERDLVPLLPGGDADLEAFRSVLGSLASLTDAPLMQFPDLTDRDELFADEYHLNGEGVAIVTERIAWMLAPILPPTGGHCPALQSHPED